VTKILDLNDKRLANLWKKYGLLFRLNGQTRVFSANDAPRHKQPIGLVELPLTGNNTISEAVMELNRRIKEGKGNTLKIIKGTKKPAPPVPQKIEQVILTKETVKYELVPDWDKRKPTRGLTKGEISQIFDSPDAEILPLSLRDWTKRNPHINIVTAGDVIYVNIGTHNCPELWNLTDYFVDGIVSGPAVVLIRRKKPDDEKLTDMEILSKEFQEE
jgi:hypothetical protein